MKAVRRTFEAKLYPKGSAERKKMNEDWLTSEYMPGYRFGVREDDGAWTPFTYSTLAKAEAKAKIENKKAARSDSERTILKRSWLFRPPTKAEAEADAKKDTGT